MAPSECPSCGHEVASASTVCPDCGSSLNNGVGARADKPPAPPEVSSWRIEPTPPELLAWARQTFDLEEHLAGMREIEETGGVELKSCIDEIEQRIRGRE